MEYQQDHSLDVAVLDSISLETMVDAVVLATCGHSFSEATIRRWFYSGHCKCPICAATASIDDLRPNYSLRETIQVVSLMETKTIHVPSMASISPAKQEIAREILQDQSSICHFNGIPSPRSSEAVAISEERYCVKPFAEPLAEVAGKSEAEEVLRRLFNGIPSESERASHSQELAPIRTAVEMSNLSIEQTDCELNAVLSSRVCERGYSWVFYETTPEIIPCPANIAGHVIGKNRKVLNLIELETGAVISNPPRDRNATNTFFYVSGAVSHVIKNAASRISKIIDAVDKNSLPIHVFVDNSNVGRGVDIVQLVKRIEKGRRCSTRFVAGSGEQNGSAENAWKSLGYMTRWAREGPEDMVDDTLHARICFDLLTHEPTTRHGRTLVLVTGDGNDHHGANNFPFCVQSALNKGWVVEMYSWRNRCARIYHNWQELKLFYLDDLDVLQHLKNDKSSGSQTEAATLKCRQWAAEGHCGRGLKCKFSHEEKWN